MSQDRSAVRVILNPVHLRRTVIVAILVGAWLTAFNQGDLLVSTAWTCVMGTKILLNFLTPFVVANLGLLSHKAESAPR